MQKFPKWVVPPLGCQEDNGWLVLRQEGVVALSASDNSIPVYL